jgi:hypothetical protein
VRSAASPLDAGTRSVRLNHEGPAVAGPSFAFPAEVRRYFCAIGPFSSRVTAERSVPLTAEDVMANTSVA